MKLLNFKEFINEGSGDILQPPKGKWIQIDPRKHKELSGEFYDLIQTAYHEIGGHSKIKSQEDVFSDPDWNYWLGIDIHNSPDLDVIIWGQKTKYGIKFSGVGHDGEKDSKKKYLDHKIADLNKPGFYGEISGKLADILIGKHALPVVNDRAEVEKVLGKKVDWHGKNPEDPNAPGDGWYTRILGGHSHAKILVGKPKV